MENEFLEKVYGYKSIKKELKLIREWYLNKDIENDKLPKGIIFFGEPGEGKTHLMREFSKSFGCPIYLINGDNDNIFDEVTKTYENARKDEMAIVIIDELDKLVKDDDKMARILQAQLDGFEKNDSVLTLASANYYYDIPEPLVREGRFDRHIKVSLKDEADIEEVIRGFAKDLKLDISDDDVSELVDVFAYRSPSIIRASLNDSYLRYGKTIKAENVIKSLDFIKYGYVENMNQQDISYNTAVHEAGHALFIYKYCPTQKFLRVSFNEDGGVTVYKNTKDKDTRLGRMDDINGALAGLIAEEIVFNKHDIGCSSDLDTVHSTAFRLMNRTCLNDVSEYCSLEAYYGNSPVSGKLRSHFESKSSRLVKKQYRFVKRILRKEKPNIIALANYMFKNQGIRRVDLISVLGGGKNNDWITTRTISRCFR